MGGGGGGGGGEGAPITLENYSNDTMKHVMFSVMFGNTAHSHM